MYIKLSAGDYTAKIDLKGANCISLKNSRYNARLLNEPPAGGDSDNPYIYGIPILFPVNRIESGRFEFDGKEYVFPVNDGNNCHIHGNIHKSVFKATNITESSVICTHKAILGGINEFEIKAEYKLDKKGLTQTIEITNLSDSNMPCLLGFHTAFNTLFTENSRAEDITIFAQISEEFERSTKTYLPTGKTVEFDAVSQSLANGTLKLLENISRHYRAKDEGISIIYDKANNLSLVYENDIKYGFRLIFSNDIKKYICIEPQNCLVNCPNSPFDRTYAGFDYISPKKSKRYVSKIYIEEGNRL